MFCLIYLISFISFIAYKNENSTAWHVAVSVQYQYEVFERERNFQYSHSKRKLAEMKKVCSAETVVEKLRVCPPVIPTRISTLCSFSLNWNKQI